MSRTVRIQYPGAVYHVVCRGDRREAIFSDDRDREAFLRTLAQMCDRTGALIHSYVLMSNHYHLLLETPEANLVAGMKWFAPATFAPAPSRLTRLKAPTRSALTPGISTQGICFRGATRPSRWRRRSGDTSRR